MRVQTMWVTILGTIVACAGLVLAIVGFFSEGSTVLGVIGAIVAVAATIGTVILYRRASSTGRPLFEQALGTDFSPDDQGWYDGSGLAIDRRRKIILLGTTEGTRRVPFDQIASVTYQPPRIGPAFGGNSILTVITFPMAIAAMVHNAKHAGMHIVTGGTTTRIAGIQPKDADRWQSHLAGARAG